VNKDIGDSKKVIIPKTLIFEKNRFFVLKDRVIDYFTKTKHNSVVLDVMKSTVEVSNTGMGV
jgi:hypothetical protein